MDPMLGQAYLRLERGHPLPADPTLLVRPSKHQGSDEVPDLHD